MDEHKTPEEIINDNAAPDAPETDAHRSVRAAGRTSRLRRATAARRSRYCRKSAAPAETKPSMSVTLRVTRSGAVWPVVLAAIVLLAASGFGVFRIAQRRAGDRRHVRCRPRHVRAA